MNRPRDRATADGLLPRMEARPRKDGLVTYRYHPAGSKPINLGTDLQAALQKVLDLNARAPDRYRFLAINCIAMGTPDGHDGNIPHAQNRALPVVTSRQARTSQGGAHAQLGTSQTLNQPNP